LFDPESDAADGIGEVCRDVAAVVAFDRGGCGASKNLLCL